MVELVRMALFDAAISVRADSLSRRYHGQEKGHRSDRNLQRCDLMEGHCFVRSRSRNYLSSSQPLSPVSSQYLSRYYYLDLGLAYWLDYVQNWLHQYDSNGELWLVD